MKLLDRTSDPRRRFTEAELLDASTYRSLPLVARPRRATDGLGLTVGILGALAIGAITFATLANNRTAPSPPPAPAAVVEQVTPEAEQEPLPLAIEPMPDMDVEAMDAAQSQAMPMVLDNTATQGAAAAPAATGEEGAEGAGGEAREAFGLNAGGQSGPVRAARPGNLSATIVEGAIIPAVLETALNSDLPGHARAIVSRDVRSFDGAAVLIPRGSRLVGQYRSATAGQSRVFIAWSRVIRPDGVSIDLASPAVDAAGAAGVTGDVDRHFFRSFGSALLQSLVGVVPGLATGGAPAVVIGGATQSAAGGQSDSRITPTIRVPIGTPIQVFTARDLSFD